VPVRAIGFGAGMSFAAKSDLPIASPLRGVLWMLAAGISFVGVNAIVRYLGTDLPAAQSAFLRFGFGVVFLLPVVLPVLRGGFAPGMVQLYAARGAVHTVAVVLWFYAMARIPLAEVTAIGYLNPVLVTLGAALFFGERLTVVRLVAFCVALIGAVIILRPGLREVTSGHLAQVAAAVFFAGSYLFGKALSGRASAATVVAMLSLSVTLGLLPFAIWVWVPVTMAQLGWLALVAAFATLGHYCMTQAFQAAPMAIIQPVTFLQLVWATLLGTLFFDEGLDVYVLIGGAVIIAAISFVTLREARTVGQGDL
jgi:drug/metabolite transporter (DMT)-like permease